MSPELLRAVSLHREGSLDDAAHHYENALAAEPLDFEALFYFAQLREAQGRNFEALGLMRAAATQRPDSAEARYRLGALFASCRQPHEAIPHLRAALELQPEHVGALNALGAALRREGHLQEAAAVLRQALTIDQNMADAHHNLGVVLRALGRPEEALVHLQRALAVRPGDADSISTAGYILGQLNRYEEALEHCRRALEIDPNLAWGHANLAEVLVDLGQFDEAKKEFQRAIGLHASPEFYAALVYIEPIAQGSPLVATLEGFAREIDALSEDERIALCFALGKVYADLGKHEAAFEWFRRGNRYKRKQIVYDEAEILSSIAATEALFTRPFVEERRDWGDPAELPIFIVGMPRSGTTLIEQILASYPGVYSAGELSTFSRIATEVLTGSLGRAIDERSMREATAAHMHEVGRRYVAEVGALEPRALRVTDKMPNNALYTGLIHLALPKARIIHAQRNPIDTCVSCYTLLFTGDQPFAYDLGELGRYYTAYEGLMRHWHRVLPEGTILNVRYEDVVADLEGQARRIIAYCGLEWSDACLEFYKTQRPVRTASATQVRKPIYTSSLNRWKPYAEHLGPLFEALGMSPQTERGRPKPSAL